MTRCFCSDPNVGMSVPTTFPAFSSSTNKFLSLSMPLTATSSMQFTALQLSRFKFWNQDIMPFVAVDQLT